MLEKVVNHMKEKGIGWITNSRFSFDGARNIVGACITGAVHLSLSDGVISIAEGECLENRVMKLIYNKLGFHTSIPYVNDILGWDFDRWLAEYKAAYPEETVDTEAIKDLIKSAETVNAVSV